MKRRFLTALLLVASACSKQGGNPTAPSSVVAADGPAAILAPFHILHPVQFGMIQGLVVFPPRNEPNLFFQNLQTVYRDTLRRPQTETFVDAEGQNVWLTEYFRFYLNGCSHETATSRTLSEISTGETLPACGAENLTFPPRDLPNDFQNRLQAAYRDILRRPATWSYVDSEGANVWMAQYLRLRVSGCDHATAESRVFTEIRGGGVQVDCGNGPMYDVGAGVPAQDISDIRIGIEQARLFFAARVGGDVIPSILQRVVVKVIASGSGNTEPGGSGACCTGASNGLMRPFFDVLHMNWLDNARTAPSRGWMPSTERQKIAIHEYTHGWSLNLGGTGITLPQWSNEGMAEFVAYTTMIGLGLISQASADRSQLSAAISSGQAQRCLATLERNSPVWPGHSGYLAIQRAVRLSSHGIMSLRILNQELVSRPFDQAFLTAFGISKTQFYADFPAYLGSIGGPSTCS